MKVFLLSLVTYKEKYENNVQNGRPYRIDAFDVLSDCLTNELNWNSQLNVDSRYHNCLVQPSKGH